MPLKYFAIQWPFSQYFMGDQSRTHLAEYELYDLLGDSAYLVREDYYREVLETKGEIEISDIFKKVSAPFDNKKNMQFTLGMDLNSPTSRWL